MTRPSPPGAAASGHWLRQHRAEIGFVAATLVWAVVMISTGDIAWPFAVWATTALVPMSRRNRG